MIPSLLRQLLTYQAHQHGRLLGLYRRFCQPDGHQWARLLKRHGGFHHIGDGCMIQYNVNCTDPAYISLGNNVHLTGCTLFGHDGAINMLKKAYGLALDKVGKIEIHDNVFVGHQAIIMPGVSIGPNAIVAAGAVVTRDVPPGCIVGGIPAHTIGHTDELVARLQAEFNDLPWRHHPSMAAGCQLPADAELDRLRIHTFFGTGASATTGIPS